MKIFFWVLIIFLITASISFSQEDSEDNNWNINPGLYFYFIPDDFFILPIVKADKEKLHLEARYNYEDAETFSGWIGYNFFAGEELEITITPMIGGVFGQSNGIAPGLELDFIYENFELYSEAEYLFNFEDGSSNFFYNWSEFTFSPTDWLWFGIVGQRMRVYQTELDIQRGLLVGGSYNDWQLSGYLFNIGSEDNFFVLSIAVDF